MDENIDTSKLLRQAVPIIQNMATSELVYNDNSGYCECHYCTLSGVGFDNRRAEIKPTDHDQDCPIRLAAAWLEKWRQAQP